MVMLVSIPSAPIDIEYAELFRELTLLARAVGAGLEAEDVAQETILHARTKIGQLREAERLRPWLRRSTVRRAGEARRRSTLGTAGTVQLLVPSDMTLGLDLRAAIARLPERERLATTLVYALGYSQQEAAEALGIRRGTIASSLSRARHKLAVELRDYQSERRR